MKKKFFIIVLFYLIFSIAIGFYLYPLCTYIPSKIILWGWIVISVITIERLSSMIYKKNIENNKLSAILEKKEKELGYFEEQLNEKEKQDNKTDVVDKKLDIEIKGEKENEIFKNLLSDLAKELSIVQGIAFKRGEDNIFRVIATYAYYYEDENEIDFEKGNGINGQAAQDKKYVILSDIPKGYIKVYSGLGESYPNHLMVWPIVIENETQYVLELAKFEKFSERDIKILKTISEIIKNQNTFIEK